MFKASDAHKFAKHVVPHVVKPARIMWNQIIGSIFLVLSFSGYSYAWRFYHSATREQGDSFRFWLAMCFAVGMTAFGIHAFLRARQISRS
jgi:hypothetical protein